MDDEMRFKMGDEVKASQKPKENWRRRGRGRRRRNRDLSYILGSLSIRSGQCTPISSSRSPPILSHEVI